mgnify:CR=1 FL=1
MRIWTKHANQHNFLNVETQQWKHKCSVDHSSAHGLCLNFTLWSSLDSAISVGDRIVNKAKKCTLLKPAKCRVCKWDKAGFEQMAGKESGVIIAMSSACWQSCDIASSSEQLEFEQEGYTLKWCSNKTIPLCIELIGLFLSFFPWRTEQDDNQWMKHDLPTNHESFFESMETHCWSRRKMTREFFLPVWCTSNIFCDRFWVSPHAVCCQMQKWSPTSKFKGIRKEAANSNKTCAKNGHLTLQKAMTMKTKSEAKQRNQEWTKTLAETTFPPAAGILALGQLQMFERPTGNWFLRAGTLNHFCSQLHQRDLPVPVDVMIKWCLLLRCHCHHPHWRLESRFSPMVVSDSTLTCATLRQKHNTAQCAMCFPVMPHSCLLYTSDAADE